MQRRLDPGDRPGRHLLEAGRLADLLDHLAQEAPRIVALAEERPIQRAEPALPLRMCHQSQPAQHPVHPAARPEDVDQRLVGV